MDEDNLSKYFKDKEKDWEAYCNHCGGCCGAFDDPCRHLVKDKGGKYSCDIYRDRFGERVTVSGYKFECVPINKLLNRYWANWQLCGYKTFMHKLKNP